MYSYVTQQQDIDILRQSTRITYAKIEVLNRQMQIINTLEGVIFNDNFSCDGSSDIRRTYTCDIILNDKSYIAGKESYIWADKYIKVYYGIKHQRSGEIYYYLIGTFSFVDMNYSFSTTERKLSLTCSDMMIFYNGIKGGILNFGAEVIYSFIGTKAAADELVLKCVERAEYNYGVIEVDSTNKYRVSIRTSLQHEEYFTKCCNDLLKTYVDSQYTIDESLNKKRQIIYAGEQLTTVLTGLCKAAGIIDYNITGTDDIEIPSDQEFNESATYYTIWSTLSELYGNYEFFFDEEGRFIWRMITTGKDEAIILDDSILHDLIISESVKDSFQNIYNATEVWGATAEIVNDDRYAKECVNEEYSGGGNVFKINLENFTTKCVLKDEQWVDLSNNIFFWTGYSAEKAYNSLYYSNISQLSGYTYQELAEDEDYSNLNNKCYAKCSVGSAKGYAFRNSACDSIDSFKSTLDEAFMEYDLLDNYDHIAIKVKGTSANYIQVNNHSVIPILKALPSSTNDYDHREYKDETVYIFCFRRMITLDDGTRIYPFLNFYYLSGFQAYGYYEETNINVPYSIPNLGYRNVKVITNEKFYEDAHCESQAQYETYKTTAKQDSISLSTIIIPFLEPNQKIRYTPFYNGETCDWIIKSFSWSTMSGTMSIEAYRFLLDYEYVYKENNR